MKLKKKSIKKIIQNKTNNDQKNENQIWHIENSEDEIEKK
jgi:hypothetical protein